MKNILILVLALAGSSAFATTVPINFDNSTGNVNNIPTAVTAVNFPAGKLKVGGASVSTFTNSKTNFFSAFVTTPEDQGGIADGNWVTDVSQTSGSPTITSASAAFTSADVGKGCTLYQGTHQSFSGTTTSSSTTVTVASTASLVAGMFASQNINASTTGNFSLGSATFTVSSASGISVGMNVVSPALPSSAILTVSAISGTSITVTASTGSPNAILTNATVPVAFNQNILAPGTTIASITNGTTFVLSAAPVSQGAVATIDFIPSWLTTTISSVTNATTAVLAVNSGATASSSRFVYGTDNTTAFQNAWNAANTALGGTIQLKRGLYCLFGEIQEPTAGGSAAKRNAIVLLPNESSGASQITVCSMLGSPVPLEANGDFSYDSSKSGTSIFCPTLATGTNASMFGGNSSASGGTISSVQLLFKDIEFRIPNQSSLGFVNVVNGGAFRAIDCSFTVDGFLTYPMNHTPPPSTGIGVLMPNFNNGDFNAVTNCSFIGLGTAIQGASHTRIEGCLIGNCGIAISWEPLEGGPITVTNTHLVSNNYNFYNNTGLQQYVLVCAGQVEDSVIGPDATLWDFFSNAGALVGNVNTVWFDSNTIPRWNSTSWPTVTTNGTSGGVGQAGLQSYTTNPATVITSASFPFTLQASSDNGFDGPHLSFKGADDTAYLQIFTQNQSQGAYFQSIGSTPLYLGNQSNQKVLTVDYADNNVHTWANLILGGTVSVTSGTNAKSGTFTLVAGVAVVPNTSVTANSVIQVTLKTVGGTRAGNPDIVPTAGTGFTATGGSLDTSTYNYWIEENN
jgi:hypothetical protein